MAVRPHPDNSRLGHALLGTPVKNAVVYFCVEIWTGWSNRQVDVVAICEKNIALAEGTCSDPWSRPCGTLQRALRDDDMAHASVAVKYIEALALRAGKEKQNG